jgi:hypothetical protein
VVAQDFEIVPVSVVEGGKGVAVDIEYGTHGVVTN